MTHAFCFLLYIPDTLTYVMSSLVKGIQILSSPLLAFVTGTTSPPFEPFMKVIPY